MNKKVKMLELMKRVVIKRNAPVLRMKWFGSKDPFWILVKAVLSSRTKDEVTLKAIENLMKKFKDIDRIINAKIEEIEKEIYPVGFYKQKAKYIKEIARYFKKNGPPKSFEELIKLPGVGRKIARIYEIYALGKDEIAVDTHVHRITNRIFGKDFKKPKEVEEFLKKTFPKEVWREINWIFVGFGQTVCLPRNPRCEECPIREFWDFYKTKGLK